MSVPAYAAPSRVLPSLAIFTALSLLVIVPLALVAYTAFTDAPSFLGSSDARWTVLNFYEILSPGFLEAAGHTFYIVVVGTPIAMCFGCGMAWLAARTDIPWKPLVHLAGVMPLFISVLVAAITWSLLGSGRSGYLNVIFAGLGLPFTIDMRSLTGIAIVEGLYYAPYAFLYAYGALVLVHPEMEEAAAVHGASQSRLLRRITFPLVSPAILGAFLLIVMLIIEDFPVAQILGGPAGIETIAVRIYRLMTQVPSRPNEACAISMVLISIVALLMIAQAWTLRGRDYQTVTGKGMQRRLLPLERWRWAATGFVLLYTFLAVILPLLALIQGSLRSNLFIPNASSLFDTSQFSLIHLRDALQSPSVQSGLVNSVLASVGAALVGTSLFLVVAYVVHRTELPGRSIFDFIAVAPIAIPALVLAMGILWTWISFPIPVYGTLAILIIAFVTRFMPQGYKALSSSVLQIHQDLESAALVSGATRITAARRIVLPLIRGSLVSAALLIFVLSMREVTGALFLYTTQTRVISIVLLESYENGVWSSVASISLIYTMLLITVTLGGLKYLRPSI